MPKNTLQNFLQQIDEGRQVSGKSITNFPFEFERTRLFTECKDVKDHNSGLIYWMERDNRLQDNWALLYAQSLAQKCQVPLFICFLLKNIHELCPTNRQYAFLTKNLKQLKTKAAQFNINFYILNATPEELSEIVEQNNIGAVICDFNPLQPSLLNKYKLVESIVKNVPVMTVDTHNIVPVWHASTKLEHMAKTIRPKIHAKLPEFLTDFPQVCVHEYSGELITPLIWDNIEDAFQSFQPIYNVPEIKWAKPGEEEALKTLHTFINKKLSRYGVKSNDPSEDCTSNLSPWLHFGHISAQRVALEVQKYANQYKQQVESFLEELIVRRELAENYCFYNSGYMSVNSAPKWAQETLIAHRDDKRGNIYTRTTLEESLTFDPIWNTAQKQLVKDGKIHSYMRMYWCKKLLEWTKTVEEAVEIAIWLNDIFSIDGSEPSGYVGIMWCLCGVHDQGFKERPIYGKIRYMVDYSLQRKFNMVPYCAKYGFELKESKKPNL